MAPGAAAPAPAGAAPAPGLPKATVQLSKGPAVGAAPKAAAPAFKSAAADNTPLYEEKDPEAGLVPLSIVCSVFAVVVAVLSLFSSDAIFSANPGEESALMVPAKELQQWETEVGDGTYRSTFNEMLQKITSKYSK